MPTFRVGMTRSIQYLIVYLIIYLNKNWRKCSVVNFVFCLIWSSQRISIFFFCTLQCEMRSCGLKTLPQVLMAMPLMYVLFYDYSQAIFFPHTQKKKKPKHLSSEQYALSLLVSICKDKLISCFRQAGWNSYYINKPKEWGFSIPNQTVTLASQNEIWIIICISSAIQDFCCTL